jgi:hypothetical protein
MSLEFIVQDTPNDSWQKCSMRAEEELRLTLRMALS